jgi:nucleotide-binding universal stress UspA family protein
MNSIRRVLCPVDFSDCSRHAFGRAAAIAHSGHASLTVLHVVPSSMGRTVVPYVGPEALTPFPLPQIDPLRVRDELCAFLAIDDSVDLNVTCLVVEAPDIDREIVAHAERRQIDLIVMGTHGRSGLRRLVLGSVAEKVLYHAPCAVLTVPASTPDLVPAGREPFRRILCAVDFSPCALHGLKYALALAEHHAAHLGVLHIIEAAPPIYDPVLSPPVDPADYESAAELVTRHRLKELIPVSLQLTHATEQLVAMGRPHREILRIASEWQSDLIVLGVHARRVMETLRFGSTIEPIVRHAPCPVLTVRLDAAERQPAA